MHEDRYANDKLLLASLSACLVSRLLKLQYHGKEQLCVRPEDSRRRLPLRNM